MTTFTDGKHSTLAPGPHTYVPFLLIQELEWVYTVGQIAGRAGLDEKQNPFGDDQPVSRAAWLLGFHRRPLWASGLILRRAIGRHCTPESEVPA